MAKLKLHKMDWNKELRYWFHRYNRLYFYNNLPVVDICYALPTQMGDDGPYKGEELMGEFAPGQDYLCRPCHSIKINWDTRRFATSVRQTILHEMVHSKVHPVRGHGEIFKREIRRLIKAGAYEGLL